MAVIYGVALVACVVLWVMGDLRVWGLLAVLLAWVVGLVIRWLWRWRFSDHGRPSDDFRRRP